MGGKPLMVRKPPTGKTVACPVMSTPDRPPEAVSHRAATHRVKIRVRRCFAWTDDLSVARLRPRFQGGLGVQPPTVSAVLSN